MRLIDGDYLYNKLVANKCPYDLVLQMVKDEPTVCDIEQIRAEIEGDMLFYEEDNCNDKDTGFVMGLQHTLDIIDRHMEGYSE